MKDGSAAPRTGRERSRRRQGFRLDRGGAAPSISPAGASRLPNGRSLPAPSGPAGSARGPLPIPCSADSSEVLMSLQVALFLGIIMIALLLRMYIEYLEEK